MLMKKISLLLVGVLALFSWITLWKVVVWGR